MGFNRRKMEDQRREAAEKEAENRRATDAQVLEDAERLIAAWNERQVIKNHFAQGARAVAWTVCPQTRVHLSLSSFTPTFCNVPTPSVIVHFPDTTCSELSLQCASQIVFWSFLGWVARRPHSN
jgi:hypothetical protein